MKAKEDPVDIITEPESWPIAPTTGGPLVNVLLRPRVYVRMREAEARARGLLPPEPKAKGPGKNKMRRAPANKATE